MQKKILLGIVCALAIAGLVGIGVMKAGVPGPATIVNVGPFDGGLTVTDTTGDDTITVAAASGGKSTVTYAMVGTSDYDIASSTLADGIYAVSGNLVFTPPTPATGVNQSFAGLMTITGNKVTDLKGVLTPGYDTLTTFTLNKVITVTFADGVATLTGTSVQASVGSDTYTITGTLKMNDIEGAKKAVENSSLTKPTISVATASYLTDADIISTVGVYRAENRTFYLRNSNDSGVAHVAVTYGNSGDVPLVFKGETSGSDGMAVYRPENTTVYLDSNNDGVAEKSVKLTLETGDVVLGGTYSGTAASPLLIKSVVYRPSTRAFYTDASGDGTLADSEKVVFGNDGDTPFLVGGSTIAVYRASNQTIYVNTSPVTETRLAFAQAGDVPVSDGINVGLYRPSTATFTLRTTTGGTDVSFVYGNPGDTPLFGDWGVSYWQTY